MLSKIYLAFFAASLLAMGFLTYYSWSWLQSIGAPQAVVEHYDFYSEISWGLLWIVWIVMLILGNIFLWSHRRSWAIWTALGFFAAFVILKYFWLDEAFLTFKKANGLSQGGFSTGPFFAVLLCVAAAAIVFFDQFIVVRLNEKMHSKKAVDDEAIVSENE